MVVKSFHISAQYVLSFMLYSLVLAPGPAWGDRAGGRLAAAQGGMQDQRQVIYCTLRKRRQHLNLKRA